MRAGLRIMVLNIDVGSNKGLPDAAEIGLAIGGVRRLVGRELTRGWNFVLGGGALCCRRITLSSGGTANAQNENSRNCKTRSNSS